MSNFFNEALFDSPAEKRQLTFKQATILQMTKFVEFVNAANELRVAQAAAARPELTGYRPAKLDESAVLEKILEKVFAGDRAFQAYLATGEVQLDTPAPGTGSKKK